MLSSLTCQCRQRGSKRQHQHSVFFNRTCQRLAKSRLQRIFHQWTDLVGIRAQKQSNAKHIVQHYQCKQQVNRQAEVTAVKLSFWSVSL